MYMILYHASKEIVEIRLLIIIPMSPMRNCLFCDLII